MLETVRYPRDETGQIPLNFTFLAKVPMYMEYHFVSDALSLDTHNSYACTHVAICENSYRFQQNSRNHKS